MTNQNIIAQLESLVSLRNKVRSEQKLPNPFSGREFLKIDKISTRNKYARVFARTLYNTDNGLKESGGSVRFFVSLENGDVLKASSWNAPAKGVRGNIFNQDVQDKFNTTEDNLYFYY